MSEALQAILVERIRARGPMPFAAYMQLALYHPAHGYYRSTERTGRRGHFMTSPELDPSFGALWGRGLERVWRALERPREFHVVEVGPGEGGFARALLATTGGSFGAALRLHLVERGTENRQRQGALLGSDPRVSWHAALPEVPSLDAGCVIANEVLDNLPVHLVEQQDGVLYEVCVAEEAGSLTTVLLPPSSPELDAFIARAGLPRRDGHRYEVTLAAESLVAHAARVVARGSIVFVDYGLDSADYSSRPFGTLAAYDSTGADTDVLARPGERDITSHANWTAVVAALHRAGFDASLPASQRDVLLDLGAGALDDHLRSRHAAAIEAGEGSRAVRYLSRRQSLGALLDPGGLGGLQVVIGSRGLPPDTLRRDGDRP